MGAFLDLLSFVSWLVVNNMKGLWQIVQKF